MLTPSTQRNILMNKKLVKKESKDIILEFNMWISIKQLWNTMKLSVIEKVIVIVYKGKKYTCNLTAHLKSLE